MTWALLSSDSFSKELFAMILWIQINLIFDSLAINIRWETKILCAGVNYIRI